MARKRKTPSKLENKRRKKNQMAHAMRFRHCRKSKRSVHGEGYYCHCGGKDEDMVECSGAACINNNWLHLSCAEVSNPKDLPDTWLCSSCQHEEKCMSSAFERAAFIGDDHTEASSGEEDPEVPDTPASDSKDCVSDITCVASAQDGILMHYV
jgi:hypothetical protein